MCRLADVDVCETATGGVDWKADAVDAAVRAVRAEKRHRSSAEGAMVGSFALFL